MGDTQPQVEFLDPGDDSGEVEWIGEEGLDSHRGAQLPPHTTARRVVGSLAVFALGLSITGYAGDFAYRHDQAVATAANALLLRGVQVGDAVTVTDAGRLGGSGAWRVDPSASIAVGVTNEGPDPITLLPGATLYGPGLAEPARLEPSGATVLRPGQSGRLTGTVTVNCGLNVATLASEHAPKQPNQSVLVQARTASGAVGAASVSVGSSSSTVRDEICQDEGDGLVASFFPESVDGLRHSFTVGVSAHSLSAQPLRYSMAAAYVGHGDVLLGSIPSDVTISMTDGEPGDGGALSAAELEQLLPGVRLAAAVPFGPVAGTLAPDASVSAGFTVHVTACPSSVPNSTAALDLSMYLDYQGQPAYFQSDSFELASLVATACGLIA